MIRHRIESDALSVQGISHGFFTRLGGVSDGIYSSLNCGYGSGDDTENVTKNRFIVADLLGSTCKRVNTPFQTHSADVIVADGGWEREDAPKADGIVTTHANVVIGVLSADCAPVLFIDPVNRVIAATHAGWRGAVGGVLEQTIEVMRSQGAEKRHIIATVGPAISQDSYEVGDEFLAHFLSIDETYASFFQQNPVTLKQHFNLPGFAVSRLHKCGIKKVSSLPYCTYKCESLFFSYRRNCHNSVADYGRQVSSIVIN